MTLLTVTKEVTGLLFPLSGNMRICDASVTKDGQARVSGLITGKRRTVNICMDEYLDGPCHSFTMVYTHTPCKPENKCVREMFDLEWRGEIIILSISPGRVEPNAEEEEEEEDADYFTDLDVEFDDEMDTAKTAASMCLLSVV